MWMPLGVRRPRWAFYGIKLPGSLDFAGTMRRMVAMVVQVAKIRIAKANELNSRALRWASVRPMALWVAGIWG